MEARQVLPSGIELDGKYRIDRVIGAGGFGITYAAHDIGLNTAVAIKEFYPGEFGVRDGTLSVRPKSDRDRDLFERLRLGFVRESRTLAQFKHPAIVRVLSVFEAHGTAYMVMELVEGQSLKTWLRGLGRHPSQAELDHIATPLLDALEVLHAANFLHRDIAPDNVILQDDGTPVLLDFGAARRVHAEATQTMTGIVKHGYSPQEQYALDSRLQGAWSDIYAFGATLYAAVSGETPHDATSRALDDQMRPAREVGANRYRPAFLAGIDAALRPNHRERPQSIRELRRLLQSPVEAGKVPSADKGDRQSHANLRWALVAGLVLALIGGAFLLGRHIQTDGLAAVEKVRQAKEDATRAEQQRRDQKSADDARRKAEAERSRQARPVEPPLALPTPGSPLTVPSTAAAREWDSLKNDRRPTLLRQFEQQYAAAPEAVLSRQRRYALAEEDWQAIQTATDPRVLQAFIDLHVGTPRVAEARQRLAAVRIGPAPFNPFPVPPAALDVPTLVPGQTLPAPGSAEAEWRRVARNQSPAVLRDFEARFPGSPEAVLSRQRRNLLADDHWRLIQDTGDAERVQNFITEHADTPALAIAQPRLIELRRGTAQPPPAVPRLTPSLGTAEAEWELIKKNQSPDIFRAFESQFPTHALRTSSRARRTTLADDEWRLVEDSIDPRRLQEFISKHADTVAAERARARLAALSKR